jgi:hypothetical protein
MRHGRALTDGFRLAGLAVFAENEGGELQLVIDHKLISMVPDEVPRHPTDLRDEIIARADGFLS